MQDRFRPVPLGFFVSVHDPVAALRLPSIDRNPSPRRTLGGPLTMICQAQSLAIGPQGNLYVAGVFGPDCGYPTVGIEIFAPGAYGNVAPLGIIAGSNTLMTDATGLAFDTAGRLYEADQGGNGSQDGGAINVYQAGAVGNVAPVARITGQATGFFYPPSLYGVAVDEAGEIFAGVDRRPSHIEKFAAGANGNVGPIATLYVPHGFLEMQIARDLLYVGAGSSSKAAVNEFRVADLSPVRKLTNMKFSVVLATADATGNVYVQNDNRKASQLFEYQPGSQTPTRVRRDGNTGRSYIVVGP